MLNARVPVQPNLSVLKWRSNRAEKNTGRSKSLLQKHFSVFLNLLFNQGTYAYDKRAKFCSWHVLFKAKSLSVLGSPRFRYPGVQTLCMLCLAGRLRRAELCSRFSPGLVSQVEKPCECYAWLVGWGGWRCVPDSQQGCFPAVQTLWMLCLAGRLRRAELCPKFSPGSFPRWTNTLFRWRHRFWAYISNY